MMRGAQCMISEGLMKELPFLALLENPSQGPYERSAWVSGVREELAGFELPATKETPEENEQFSQRQMQYQRLQNPSLSPKL